MLPTSASKKRLGDMLVESGLITPAQLQEALNVQKHSGERLGRTLINLGFVTEQDILNILELQLGIPQITLTGKLNSTLVKSISESLIKRHKVIPVKKEGNRIMVAMFDPLNVVALDDLKLATGFEIDPVLVTEQEIDNAIQRIFGFSHLEKAFQQNESASTVTEAKPLRVAFGDDASTDEAPVIRLLNSVIAQAANEKASDIHIEPQEAKIIIRIRVDGLLREILRLPRHVHAPLTSRVKIMAGMDIAEKRLPQDGRIQIKYGGRDIDLRVSTLPTIFGEKVVLRLLDKTSDSLSINQLGFVENNLERFLKIIKNANGMVLLTGPTGSGKTTTLYAILNELRSHERNIITIEDPVEYIVEGINQTQVNVKAGFTFAVGLRSILRQDPDIIMVGEIRDSETAEIAVRAASTGHLVLSTMHTNHAAGALTRLMDMGIEPFLVASSVLGVVAQRLVRRVCLNCKQLVEVGTGTPEQVFVGEERRKGIKLFTGKGCPQCGNTGYRGRTSIQEILPLTRDIRSLVMIKSSSDEIKRQALVEGMVPLKEDGIRKAMSGVTSIQEVMRVAYSDDM